MKEPLLTVCVPTVGSSPFLDDTLRSVKAAWQEGLAFALIDNACPEPLGPELLLRHGLPGRVVRHARRLSLAENWNNALALADTPWVHILHDDDWVDPAFYARALDALRRHPEVGLWVCATREECLDAPEEEFDVPMPLHGAVADPETCADALFRLQVTRCVSTVLNRAVARGVGGFDPAMTHHLDLDLFWRCAARAGAYFEPEVLGHYRANPHSLSQWTGRRGRKAPVEDGRVLRDTLRLLDKNRPPAAGSRAVTHYARGVFPGLVRYHLRRGQLSRLLATLRLGHALLGRPAP